MKEDKEDTYIYLECEAEKMVLRRKNEKEGNIGRLRKQGLNASKVQSEDRNTGLDEKKRRTCLIRKGERLVT